MLPKDPYILLSFVNTKLRDDYPSLDEFCEALDHEKETLCEQLAQIGFQYDEKQNRFS